MTTFQIIIKVILFIFFAYHIYKFARYDDLRSGVWAILYAIVFLV